MRSSLTQKHCQSCEGGVPPLARDQAKALLREVAGWELSSDGKWLSRKWTCTDFAKALRFVNWVGEIAEAEGHHPDIHLTGYRNVRLDLSTHAIGGLSENDFIVAAKVNARAGGARRNPK